jgi:serine protease Do
MKRSGNFSPAPATLAALLLAAAMQAGCQPNGAVEASRPIDFQKIIASAKQKVYPCLVFVKPILETFEGGERQRVEVFGSGVIISPDGYVVSNNHVCEKAVEVNCVLGDRVQVPATVVGLDPETDLALLKLTLPPGTAPLPVAEFADSDKVEAGQFVMALGSPFGFTRSISLGIISNTRRYIGFTTQYRYNLWLQTDAAINPGNSGGPLVDTDGKVAGINTLGIGMAEGIGFAIPSNVVSDVIRRLRAASAGTSKEQWPVKVHRAYTGLQIQALNDFKSNTFTDANRGVLIQSVDQGSPGEAAGLRDGDLLLAVGGKEVDGLYVEDLPALRVMLADLPPDAPTTLMLARKTHPASTSDAPGVPATQPASAPNVSGADAIARAGADAMARAGAAAAAANADTVRDYVPVLDDPPPAYAGKLGPRKVLTASLTPVTRGKFEGEDFDCRHWNMTVKEITKFSNPRLYFIQPTGGVFIQGVRGPGNAADAGLRPNDVVLKIDKWEIKTIEDVKKAYAALVGDAKRVDKKALVTIKRDGFLDFKPLSWEKDYLQED